MIPFIGLEFYSNDKFFLRFLHANKSTKLFGGVKSMTADKNEDEIDKNVPHKVRNLSGWISITGKPHCFDNLLP